jgi:crossover junction endodeoxyribonuclease RuvC
MTPRVIGLDLSLTGTGIASSLGWCERVGIDGVTVLDLSARMAALRTIRGRVLDLAGQPDLAVVEQIAYSRTNGGAAERAGLWFEVTGHLIDRGVEVASVTTGTLKTYATGSGQKKGASTKGAVIDAVARRWPAYETGGDDNLCDAVVLAAMGADHLGHPLVPMPKTHRVALATVWPEADA